ILVGANDGASPVMIAAQQGFTDCIEFLLKSGANPNRFERKIKLLMSRIFFIFKHFVYLFFLYISYAKDGVNAIHLAAECGHHRTLELLLKKLNTDEMESQLRPE